MYLADIVWNYIASLIFLLSFRQQTRQLQGNELLQHHSHITHVYMVL